ncbi:hypothetical protein [Streptomyces sp. NRRL S-813]|uniref:hypothetical protein n=1 Tax=Streptomyces sp. NRRL S-813 TaxID=1463919 RepID=UPI0004C0E81E|nr:hypothetical protein [Streptomyces sp. NRRL S-813]
MTDQPSITGYCPACGRGDAAPTADDWEQQRKRAEQLAGVLDEVLRHFVHKGHPGEPCLQTGWISEKTVARWRAALYQPAPADEPSPANEAQFGSQECTCIPWTRRGGTARDCGPNETVDDVAGWERRSDCPHHAPPARDTGPTVREAAAQDKAHWNDKYAGDQP